MIIALYRTYLELDLMAAVFCDCNAVNNYKFFSQQQ